MSEAAPLRPALHVAPNGELVVGWYGPLGPAVARFEQWSRERPIFARTLGVAGACLPVVPAFLGIGEDLLAFWCEEDGVHGARLGADGSEQRTRLLLEGAHEVAIAGGKSHTTLFCADEAGIVRLDVSADLEPIAEPRRCVSERRAGAMLVAARLRDDALLAFAHRGAPGFGVVLARSGGEVVVRHQIAERKNVIVRGHGSDFIEDLDLRAAGGRAAIALELQGGKIYQGEIGPDGQVTERPHPLFPRESASLGSPQVVWTEDAFSVLALERESGRLRVEPLGKNGEPFVLPRCGGAFAAAFTRQHFFALEAAPTDDGAQLSLWRVKRTGKEAQQRVFDVKLEDAEPRRQRMSARRMLTSLSDQVEQAHGYRDRGARASVARDGAKLELIDEAGRLSLGVSPVKDVGFLACVTSELGGETALPDATSSMVRLARRIREWLFPSAPEVSEAERAWANDLAERIGARLIRFERAGAVVILEVALAALPHAERLERWLRELRKEQTERFASPK